MSDYCKQCLKYEKCDNSNCCDKAYQQGKADGIDEVLKKLYDIRDSLPFKYSEHWTSRDSDAISTLFIEYEKQLKEQKND